MTPSLSKLVSRHGKFAENKEPTSFLIEKDVKAALRKLAKTDGRTLSNFIANELTELVRQHLAANNPEGGAINHLHEVPAPLKKPAKNRAG